MYTYLVLNYQHNFLKCFGKLVNKFDLKFIFGVSNFIKNIIMYNKEIINFNL